ncbi:MAG TPA: alpha-L-fucosidase [Dinghuibacter sp.]|uniref:alpha-L-fucosidase n=1 Tax=Dinghuibacter sp. TaxID=2024697 RepID=UPI002C71F3E2|nr:alpha-L-fucosidase [Dinghuibacter sp.]HTJ10792.1 alpha-L-fucosidase [Dinghuibacter sp.]
MKNLLLLALGLSMTISPTAPPASVAARPAPTAARAPVRPTAPVALTAPRAPVAPPAPYGALPTARQLSWQETEMYCIVCYGVNTYLDHEWGYGNEDPRLIDPTDYDPAQVVGAAKAGGFRGIVLVAKHHDGLCLWPSRSTTRTIAQSNWRQGRGDMVKDYQVACRHLNMRYALYCSPWDRNNPAYGTPAYIDVYRQQLTELYTSYGPLFMSWFDGANGGDGFYGGAKETRTIDRTSYYGWDSIWALTRRLQPAAAIFGDVGPDVRWVGNEQGIAGKTCWETFTPQAPEPGRAPANGFSKAEIAVTGTRNGAYWMPAECDVPIRPGWFYHESENHQVKTPRQLLDLYYASVGRGACLDLGLAPDKRGRLDDHDVLSLKMFGELLRETFAKNLAAGAHLHASNTRGGDDARYGPRFLLDGDRYTCWATDDSVHTPSLTFDLDTPKTFNVIRLRENIKLGQRIDSLAVDVREGGRWLPLATATSIGANRLIRLGHDVTASQVRLRITGSPACIALSDFGLFREPPATSGEPANGEPADGRAAGMAPRKAAHPDWTVVSATRAEIVVDMGRARQLSGFTYSPPSAGMIDHYAFSTSPDGRHWTPPQTGEFSNIAANPLPQHVRLDAPVTARYFRFTALRTAGNGAATAAKPDVAQLDVDD